MTFGGVDLKLARAVDKDGFTNVRSGAGLSFEVIDSVKTDELFYCEPLPNGEWYKIHLIRYYSGQSVDRFMHRSRVEIIENLHADVQRSIVLSILNKQKLLADGFVTCNRKYNRKLKKWNSQEDSAACSKAVRKLEAYSDNHYTPILEILSSLFCKTKDRTIIDNFVETMLSDSGSANEMPSFSIGECFNCDTKMLSALIRSIKNQEDKKLIADNVEWGLLNKFSVGENGKSTNQQFLELKRQLDLARK